MINVIVGTDLLFKVVLTASGFSQATDDWEVAFVLNGAAVLTSTKSDAILSDGEYFVPVDTSDWPTGTLTVQFTAMVPDATQVGGVRREVCREQSIFKVIK